MVNFTSTLASSIILFTSRIILFTSCSNLLIVHEIWREFTVRSEHPQSEGDRRVRYQETDAGSGEQRRSTK